MAEPRGEREHPLWQHQKGDRYVPVFGDFFGNPEVGYSHEWSLLGGYDTHAGARRTGFREQGSDDFNIAVVRDRKVVALLWMDEVLDTEPAELAPLQAVLFGSDVRPGPTESNRTNGDSDA